MAVPVQFSPFSTFVHPTFWGNLSELKLEVYGLDDSVKEIAGFYVNSDAPNLSTRFTVDYNACEGVTSVPRNSIACQGSLLLTNTIENFKEMDRKTIMKMMGNDVWNSIKSGECLNNLSLLSKFVFTAFANMKKYHYHFWIGFPALLYPKDINLMSPIKSLQSSFPSINVSEILNECITSAGFESHAAFLIIMQDNSWETIELATLARIRDDFGSSKVILVVCDPSTMEAPGWPVRNFLATWAFWKPSAHGCELICLRRRFTEGAVKCGHSLYMNITYAVPEGSQIPPVVGWARNDKQLLAPQFVDMSKALDPVKVSSGAVDFNLHLMRWRLVPELELDNMKSLKCLLFGAGTLGCNVARMLLAWGVRHITFVDNSTVSYSNPVRQSLFKFSDSIKGGRKKAKAAAEAVLEILPSATVTGLESTVPMPGHPIMQSDIPSFDGLISDLDSLVQSHDVVFLLMDSREGRWLPTLLASVHNKITFSMALGFDSYVILRHGCRAVVNEASCCTAPVPAPVPAPASVIPGSQLGCYFCSDVTAPGNSQRDRSLDQQCTVTRPGLSMITAGFGVELLASLVQHPLKGAAPAIISGGDNDEHPDGVCSCLGNVPHQIRGYVSRFEQITPCVQRFHSCIACSDQVMDMYRNRGSKYILDVCNDPGILEKTTGLTELQATTELMEVWELSDTESVKSMESNL